MAEAADFKIAQMTLVDWLDDLTVRFLLNLPPAELSSVPRLCFQVEEAQWFYEDFIRPANPSLPSLNLRQFLLTLFQHCPLLSGFDATQHVAAYEEFLSYKVRVPVRGAILMDDSMEKVLLVRGWKKGSSWSFPRGKINKDEKDLDCAIREVYEETGYDIAVAGLVEPNEQQDGHVKAIDITMREQHMKLFVFRGVPLDSHFEPRTRKEISKISWYNVKDLPGFKKQKGLAGQGQGEAATTKFYMVAPFLGPLKKWIGQQRRDDHAAAQARNSKSLSGSNELQAGTTEEEGDTEQEFATDNGMGKEDRSADELKRLLSIGGLAATQSLHSTQPRSAGNTNDLLAMLKGSQPSLAPGGLPHTPMEQIDPAFPATQPKTPQAHHPRKPSFHQQLAVSQLPHSPQSFQQQQQRNLSLPASDLDGHLPRSHAQAQQSRYANLPAHMQQLFQQHNKQQRSPVPDHGQIAVPQNNVTQSSQNLFHQVQGSQSLAHHNQNWQNFAGPAMPLASPLSSTEPPPATHKSPFWQTKQEVQQPLGSEHSVPEPSKLPPPKLNEHSLKLLNVFKGTGGRNTSTSTKNSSAAQLAGSEQQAALLDLFRRAPDVSTLSTTSREPPISPAPASPALTDVTVKPAPSTGKHASTLNEITRTLPIKSKGNSIVSLKGSPQLQQSSFTPTSDLQVGAIEKAQPKHPTQSQQTIRASMPNETLVERPKSRGRLHDPSDLHKFTSASSLPEEAAAAAAAAETKKIPPILAQRPSPRHSHFSPRASAKPKAKTTSNEAVNAVPQFSILQRPGSSAGLGTRAPAPQSPLRQESTPQGFQPQLLRRTESVGVDGFQSTGQGAAYTMASASDTKKDHLLSLFGKSYNVATTAAQNPTSITTTSKPQAENRQTDTLLGLFNGAAASSNALKTPEPPPAPRLSPERKPSGQGQQPSSSNQTSQQTLLNLFNKSSSGALASPGTPISPFALTSPVASGPPPVKLSVQASEPMSRLGSMASVVSNGTASGQQTPKSATPTAEAKGFLLDYLNGVVQKEGYRGAKKQ